MRGSAILISLFVLGASLGRCTWRPATAADVAAEMQGLVGDRDGEVSIKSIVAEGNALVITIDGPPGWRQALPSYAITAYFIDRVCENPKATHYFEHGRVLRIDSTDKGAFPVHGVPMNHCPPPSTSAITG
jgi:hypothetical protein